MKAVYIPTPFGELYCRVSGTGNPLLLLHGNGEDQSIFQHQLSFFSRYYTVIALDTRGHGQSPIGKGELSFDQFEKDIKTVLAYFHIEKTSLIGFSDGGNTALLFAERHPDKVRAMVVVGANVEAEGMVNGELKKVTTSVKRLRGVENVCPKAKEKREMMDLMWNQLNRTEFNLKNIQVPTLVMAGENDVIKQSHTEMIAQQIKDSQLVIVPGADHYLIMKIPEVFNKTALEFLKRY